MVCGGWCWFGLFVYSHSSVCTNFMVAVSEAFVSDGIGLGCVNMIQDTLKMHERWYGMGGKVWFYTRHCML